MSRDKDKPRHVRAFEEAYDMDDPFAFDGYHVEDIVSVAAWYRSRLEEIESTLEEED